MPKKFIDPFALFFKGFYLFIFRERGREGERERNTNVREIHDWLPLACPHLGTWPAIRAGVSNLLVSLGHTGRRRVVLGHTLNTQTLTKSDEQKKKF